MTVSPDLLLAILSLDAYNRGYNAGIGSPTDGLGSGKETKVGPATILTTADSSEGSAERSAGFYAVAYKTEYGTVISYRGTDNPNPLAGASDFWSGWTVGAGFTGASTQADEALEFYRAVTGKNYWEGAAENTIVTGHSLGGGLAGFVSFLSGTKGVGFDHMPFGIAAALQNLSTPPQADGANSLTTSNFTGYRMPERLAA